MAERRQDVKPQVLAVSSGCQGLAPDVHVHPKTSLGQVGHRWIGHRFGRGLDGFPARLDAFDRNSGTLACLLCGEFAVPAQGHAPGSVRAPDLDDVGRAPGAVHAHPEPGQIPVPEGTRLAIGGHPVHHPFRDLVRRSCGHLRSVRGIDYLEKSKQTVWKWHQIQRFLERSVFGIAMTVTQWCNGFMLQNQVVIMLGGVQGVFVAARAKDYPTSSPEIAMPQNRKV